MKENTNIVDGMDLVSSVADQQKCKNQDDDFVYKQVTSLTLSSSFSVCPLSIGYWLSLIFWCTLKSISSRFVLTLSCQYVFMLYVLLLSGLQRWLGKSLHEQCCHPHRTGYWSCMPGGMEDNTEGKQTFSVFISYDMFCLIDHSITILPTAWWVGFLRKIVEDCDVAFVCTLSVTSAVTKGIVSNDTMHRFYSSYSHFC